MFEFPQKTEAVMNLIDVIKQEKNIINELWN